MSRRLKKGHDEGGYIDIGSQLEAAKKRDWVLEKSLLGYSFILLGSILIDEANIYSSLDG